MRIAIFSDNFYPEISGISDSIITTGKELAKLGHKINFFAPKYSRKNYDLLKLPNEEINLGENIRVTRLTSFPYPTGTAQSRLVIPCGFSLSAVKKFNPDIIHTNDIASMGIEALICAKFLKKPLVGTDHTPMVEFLKYSPIKGKFIQSMISRYDALYYNQCNFVSSPCNAIFEEIEKFGFNKPVHKALSNPIYIEEYKPVKNKWSLKKKYGLFDYSILYMGRLAFEKRIDISLKALAKLVRKYPKIGFVIAGKGAVEKDLKTLTKELDLENNVKFFGFLKDKKDMVGIYNACDLFSMTSIAETQSIVMMQAMACKIPVIAVKAWGLKEYVNEKNGILINVNNPDELAEKIEYLYNNPSVSEKLGEGGRDFVENFSPIKIAKEWESIYEETIKSYKSSR